MFLYLFLVLHSGFFPAFLSNNFVVSSCVNIYEKTKEKVRQKLHLNCPSSGQVKE